MKIKLFGLENDSIVDGPGIRYAIFTQGCYHNCKGCHNIKSHDINGGFEKEVSEILKEIDENSLLDGITLSGGEPLLQPIPLIELCKEIKKRNLTIILYSGYKYEEILTLGHNELELLKMCDILIDGKFVYEKRSLSLLYRGSSNQRIIDVKQSLLENKVIEYEF